MWWACIKSSSAVVFLLIVLCCNKNNSPLKAKLYLPSSLSLLADDLQLLSNNSIEMVFLSSASIARQVEQGAFCDAIVLADSHWQAYLTEKDLSLPDAIIIAKNSLVLVGNNNGTKTNFYDALKKINGHIIIGDPDFVPLGFYTKQALIKIGLWDHVQYHIIKTPSARQASMMFMHKRAPFAIVFQSDAKSLSLPILAEVPFSLHKPIEYPLLRCKNARNDKASYVENLLLSDKFHMLLVKWGFSLADNAKIKG